MVRVTLPSAITLAQCKPYLSSVVWLFVARVGNDLLRRLMTRCWGYRFRGIPISQAIILRVICSNEGISIAQGLWATGATFESVSTFAEYMTNSVMHNILLALGLSQHHDSFSVGGGAGS